MADRRGALIAGGGDDWLVGVLARADIVQEVKDKMAGQLVEEISQPVR